MPSKTMRLLVTALWVAIAAPTVSACGDTANDDEVSSATSSPADTLIEALPDELQGFYEGMADPVLPSAYEDFEAVDTPWKLCLVYQAANSWIEETRLEMERVAALFEAEGLVSGGLEIAETGGEVALENRQIRAMISQQCSVIFLVPVSPNGSNSAIEAAYHEGIPVVSVGGAVTSPYAINVIPNNALFGQQQAEEIVRALGEQGGNVLMVGGIEGVPSSTAQADGAEHVWRQHDDINVVGRVFGNYDLATTKSVVLQTLATHADPIDAVWTAGAEIRGVIEAFRQANRPVPIITGTPSADVLTLMTEDPDLELFGRASVPYPVATTAMRVGVRLLEGQRPKLGTIAFVYPEWGRDNLDEWHGPCMTATSQLPFPVPPQDVLTEEQMNGYFVDGQATPPYEYNTPRPCE